MRRRFLITQLLLTVTWCFAATSASAEEPKSKPVADWGKFTDPDNDCKLELVADKKNVFTITVPGKHHDLHPPRGKTNAPRLLKKIDGNFTLQVKVTGDFQPGKGTVGPGRAFNGAGLLVWENELNYLRLERNAYWAGDTLYCYPPLIEHWFTGQYRGFNSSPVEAKSFFQGKSTWLKMTREGEQVKTFYSHDGEEWELAKEFLVGFPDEIEVGVTVINAADEAFTATFSDLKVEVTPSATN